MSDDQRQIYQAINQAIENLKTLAERKPETPVGADDFNMLLEQAKAAFPDVATVQGIKPLEGGSNVAAIVLKLSLLQGPIKSHFSSQAAAAVAQANRQSAARFGRGLLDR